MYLLINDNKYTVSRRIKEKDTLKFLSVFPNPENITGNIEMYRDDGFLLSTDNIDDYKKVSYTGTLLKLTNITELPKTTPTITQILGSRIAVLEEKNASISERLAETDEIAIELYEAGLAQEAINAEQDEAIIDIYELMEAMNNG